MKRPYGEKWFDLSPDKQSEIYDTLSDRQKDNIDGIPKGRAKKISIPGVHFLTKEERESMGACGGGRISDPNHGPLSQCHICGDNEFYLDHGEFLINRTWVCETCIKDNGLERYIKS